MNLPRPHVISYQATDNAGGRIAYPKWTMDPYRLGGAGASPFRTGFDFAPLAGVALADAATVDNIAVDDSEATVTGAQTVGDGGGFAVTSGKLLLLPDAFKFTGDDAHVGILMWIASGVQTISGAQNGRVAGWSGPENNNANWLLSFSAASPDHFSVSAAGQFLAVVQLPDHLPHQLGLEFTVDSGRIYLNLYLDGRLSQQTSAVFSGWTAPANPPMVGWQVPDYVFSDGWVGELFSIDAIDWSLNADIPMATIVAANFNAWKNTYSA